MNQKTETSIDTRTIYSRLAGDFVAAAASATAVTPAVAIIDRALVEKASCNWPLLRGLRSHTINALKRPGRFLFSRPFGLIWTLYAATYAVANGADTITKETIPTSPIRDPIVFASTFTINVPLGVWKDMRFAQLFSTCNSEALHSAPIPTRTFSKTTTAMFLLRDGITISGSFTLPPYCARLIPESLAADPHSGTVITQIVVPVLSQVIATPVHLLGLDLYSRPRAVGVNDRFWVMGRFLPSATVVRCVRIIPAFGFGCLTNMELREYFHDRFNSSRQR